MRSRNLHKRFEKPVSIIAEANPIVLSSLERDQQFVFKFQI